MEHRTYLWLHLAIDDIRTTYQDGIRPEMETIQSVPSLIDNAYERILSRVKQTQYQTVKTILKIIVGAHRPLSIGEVALALGLALSTKPKTFQDVAIDPGYLERNIRNWCGLFVFVNHSKIYLIHQTARECLLVYSTPDDNSWKWKSSLSNTDVESTLMSIGVRCLSLEDSTSSLVDYESTRAQALEDDSKNFIFHSCESWPDHLQDANSTSIDDAFDSVLNLHNPRSRIYNFWFPEWWKVKFRYESLPKMTDIRFAACIGHERVLKYLLDKQDEDKDGTDDQGRTALYWGSYMGHEKVVLALLDHQADVNAQGGQYGNALQAASAKGHEQAVRVLLDLQADVNTQGGLYGNALRAASINGHEQAVRVLLEHQADVNAKP